MEDFCINHPDRRVSVKIHEVKDGEHTVTPMCFDCACEAGDETAIMLRHQSQVMNFIDKALSPTPLSSEAVS